MLLESSIGCLAFVFSSGKIILTGSDNKLKSGLDDPNRPTGILLKLYLYLEDISIISSTLIVSPEPDSNQLRSESGISLSGTGFIIENFLKGSFSLSIFFFKDRSREVSAVLVAETVGPIFSVKRNPGSNKVIYRLSFLPDI